MKETARQRSRPLSTQKSKVFSMTELKAEGLVKSFHDRAVVNDVSLGLSDHSIVGLLGPNGAGKTTIFYLITGLIRPDKGRILLNGKDITNLPMHQRACNGITYLPQESSVFRKLSVGDNIRLVLETRGLSRTEIEAKTPDFLNEMGLSALIDQKAQSLSGGQQRRLEVLRALATDPTFILLDEPFAGVDPLAISDLREIILGLKARGLGVFISDHNVHETLTVCDRAYIVNLGSVIEEGPPDYIASSDLVRKIYLGEKFTL